MPPDQNAPVTVLIVDDSEVARELLRDLLETCGYEVIGEAKNGEEAVQKYFALRPQLTFMDIKMPVMGGIEASREILNVDADARIVVCSASDAGYLTSVAAETGARGWLAKPYLQDNVEAVVRRALR